MTLFDDIPLPGLELEPRHDGCVVTARRAYSNAIAPSPHTIDRFWSRVIRSPGCWLWVGAISGGDGYGRTWRHGATSRTESAHRFALLIADQLTDGVIGEHRCNEPLCLRVGEGHLIASTQAANLRYAVTCGRTGIIRSLLHRQDRHARSLAVRAAVAGGWNAVAYARASGNTTPLDTPQLF